MLEFIDSENLLIHHLIIPIVIARVRTLCRSANSFRLVRYLCTLLKLNTANSNALVTAWLSENIELSAIGTRSLFHQNLGLNYATLLYFYGSAYNQRFRKYAFTECSIKYGVLSKDLHRIAHEVSNATSPDFTCWNERNETLREVVM